MSSPRTADALKTRLEKAQRESGATALGVAVCDIETGFQFGLNADTWFHAASTIKLPILVGVYAAIHRGDIQPQSRLHVRNRFHSAYDGTPFRVPPDRDANSIVHRSIGRMLHIHELAVHMIATSSNLATNLLLDLVGIHAIKSALVQLGAGEGIDLRRGVEDERAFENGISNRVTANGLARLLRVIAEEKAFTPELSRQMLDILHAQEFRSRIPARLPKDARVAHKTGDISTVAHDAGVVYLPDRRPYVLAVLTGWEPDAGERSDTIADISHEIYEHLMALRPAPR